MAKTAVQKAQLDDQPVTFERPPVNEVFVSVQTKEKVFPASDFGSLVRIFGTEFPKLNTYPRLDRASEPEQTTAVPLGFQLDFSSAIGQRFWLISQDDTRVLQIQEDRVVLNWRRRSEGEYPRYRKIRAEFEDALTKLTTDLALNTDDMIDFCEVSYTNHIELPDGSDPRSHMERIFRHVRPVDLGLSYLSSEESSFTLTFAIHDLNDQFVGRMRIITTPAILRKEKRFIFQTQLSFRGKPADGTLKCALQFCDQGHQSIVLAFDRITTEEMHKFWGKT